MDVVFLLGVMCLCSPLTALVLDFNTIRGSAEVTRPKKCSGLDGRGLPCWEVLGRASASCHGLQQRCQRNAMCCPGTLCLNGMCSQTEKLTRVDEKKHTEQAGSGSKDKPHWLVQKGNIQKKGNTKSPSETAQKGERCLRTSDCAPSLCCARHFWGKICKPILTEGQACSRQGQKEGAHGPEIFQRCDCGPGLSCQLSHSRTSQCSRLSI